MIGYYSVPPIWIFFLFFCFVLWRSKIQFDIFIQVRQRRRLYEKERADREEEQQLVQREKEAAQFRLWEEQEDVFHLRQAQLRSDIRIRDGRAKPIDRLAQYINTNSEDLGVDVHEPYTHVEGLEKGDLEDLLQDIMTYSKVGEWPEFAVLAGYRCDCQWGAG